MRITPKELSRNQKTLLEQIGKGVSGFGIEYLTDIKGLEDLGLISILKVHRFKEPSAEHSSEWVLVSPAGGADSAAVTCLVGIMARLALAELGAERLLERLHSIPAVSPSSSAARRCAMAAS